ncbi:MAG: hypothetical protein H0W99_10450, partial [Acidobacteria bacterium]|nr:hypothetical protein [Acidobacteriota bacterium]
MKKLSQTFLSLTMSILLMALPIGAAAQEKRSQDADLLKNKIELLEKTDIKSKSPSVQDIYKRSLLRLYDQYVSALEQDIADMRAIQSTVNGTNSEAVDEVATKIQKLINEQQITSEKIQTLRGDIRTAASSAMVANQPVVASREPQIIPAALNRPASSIISSSATFTRAESTPVAAINSIPSIASVAPAPAATAEEAAKVLICGQIRPASLTQTFAFIRSASDTRLGETQRLALSDQVHHSSVGPLCEDDAGKFKVDSQREAVVDTL